MSADYFAKFGIGDVAYVAIKAARDGILEKLYIKEILVPETSDVVTFNYRDTWNEIWMESELVTYAEVLILVETYGRRAAPPIESVTVGGDVTLYPEPFYLNLILNEPLCKMYERDTRYIKQEAMRGKVVSVAVKKCIARSGGRLYEDSYNEVWREDELVSRSEAIEIAQDYLNGL